MPYVIYDERNGKYVTKVTGAELGYAYDIKDAKVYRNSAGVLNAVGEPDRSFENLGKYPASKTLKLPKYMKMIEVEITEKGLPKKVYGGLE